jgi:hypothetical protein
MFIDPQLAISLTGWALGLVLLTGLLAPFSKLSRRADAHILPALILAGSTLLSFLAKRKANQAAKDQLSQTNANEKARADAANSVLADLKANGVNLAGPITRTSGGTQSGTSTTNSRSHSATQQRKVVDAAQAGIKAQLEAETQKRLGQRDFVTPAEKAAILTQIASATRGQEAKIAGAVAGRNLAPGSVQSVMLNNPVRTAANAATIGAMSDWEKTNRAEQEKARAEASGLLNAWQGQDSTTDTTGTSTTDSSSTSTGFNTDPLGGVSTLAALRGVAVPQLQSTNTGYSPWISGAQDLLGAAAQWYMGADGKPKKVPASGGGVFDSSGDYMGE